MARFLFSFAAVVSALSPLVLAGIKFTAPEPGAKLTAGSAITVKWDEGDSGPAITDLQSYQLQLIVGGNKPDEQFVASVITPSGLFSAGNSASGRIEAGVSDDLENANAYFVKMIAVPKAGGQYIVYSDRFAYSGMKGKDVLDPTVKKAALDADGTAGPPSQDQSADSKPDQDDLYGVEYTMQNGLTRYAPMQPVPPTKITATNTKPLYPTSSVRIATTKLPIPSQQTTLTASQTFSTKSRENTVAPAPHATDDMAKFLRRWQD